VSLLQFEYTQVYSVYVYTCTHTYIYIYSQSPDTSNNISRVHRATTAPTTNETVGFIKDIAAVAYVRIRDLSLSPSIHPSIYLSICLSIYLSVCLSVCLSA
jgi:hypothetical protein